MERISFSSHLLKEPVKDAPRSKRAELIGKFLERLNKDREGTKYPPLKAARVATMLAPIKTPDLYSFLKECEYSTHFSKHFFWCYKSTKSPQ